MSNEITATQQIQQAKVWLMRHEKFKWAAGIIMMGNCTIVAGNHKIKTAATDGKNEWYHEDFLRGKTKQEVRYLVAHEMYHKLFRHLTVYKGLFKKDGKRANIATDAVINTQYLAGIEGITFIEGGIQMPEYANKDLWNAKRIFDDLEKRGGGGKGGGEGGHDQHLWEEAGEMSEAEQKELEAQIDVVLRQAAGCGALNGDMPREALAALVPPVDWRDLLSDFVKSMCFGFDKQTWRRPHRTYLAHDLYMPSPYSESIERILIAVDTSGSIGGQELNVFLGFMQQLVDEVQPNGVDIIWWGTGVAGVDSFEKGNIQLAGSVKPVGGGGTDPTCIPAWIRKQKREYVACVVFTDGEFRGVGDWTGLPPVCWLVVNDRDSADIPVGKVVKIKEVR